MSSIQITQELPSNIVLSKAKFQKMMFIMNALSSGWTVKKTNDSYIFTKKHEHKREVFETEYLETFVQTNSSIDISDI